MRVLAALGGIVGLGILMVASSIFNGYVLSVLWGWFIVPTFGVPPLGIVPAIGIALIVNYLTQRTKPIYKEKDDCEEKEKITGKQITYCVGLAILRPSFALFLGWIVHLFM